MPIFIPVPIDSTPISPEALAWGAAHPGQAALCVLIGIILPVALAMIAKWSIDLYLTPYMRAPKEPGDRS